jgi:hypothetical protein
MNKMDDKKIGYEKKIQIRCPWKKETLLRKETK